MENAGGLSNFPLPRFSSTTNDTLIVVRFVLIDAEGNRPIESGHVATNTDSLAHRFVWLRIAMPRQCLEQRQWLVTMNSTKHTMGAKHK